MDIRRRVTDALLDRTVRVGSRARHDLRGSTILVTGATSGIGRQLALDLAAAGADLIVVARRADDLAEVVTEAGVLGATATPLTCDLADPDDRGRLLDRLRDEPVDALVNNAGRSIRRSVVDTVDRTHDYRRMMDLNYFGAVELTVGLLPGMIDRGRGHIVNVCTWGVTAGAMPRFAGYHATKAALAAFGRSLAAELDGTGVAVTNVNFPLVRTPMIAPTAQYDDVPALPVETASEWILHALEARPEVVEPLYVFPLRVLDLVTPSTVGKLVAKAT
ncbi:SDR family NAD(P)-dependent oxidoreductase [Gordonia soli]|uniref:Putative acyl-CoA reductase n=1 Tax=Gordonia soli NBRC 108243 TaxID=1223545 RepID=M0QNV1_9ACTN|nr:SDR family NAD(P)-dependent oxidoreductase [Gordonia soli]GAC70253.1 putative acyl-CoA reductase [Gordonia soli NBRC 108243]